MKRFLARIEQAGGLLPQPGADRGAELAWSLVHFASWRLLVIEFGWSPKEFRRSQLAIIRRMLRKSGVDA